MDDYLDMEERDDIELIWGQLLSMKESQYVNHYKLYCH